MVVSVCGLRFGGEKSYGPVQLGELERDRVPAVQRTLVRNKQVFRRDRPDEVVLEVMDEAIGDVVDRRGAIERDGRVRAVTGGRKRFVGDEVREGNDLFEGCHLSSQLTPSTVGYS